MGGRKVPSDDGFEVTSSASIGVSADGEGMNASRFALLGVITLPPRELELGTLYAVDPEVPEVFGFSNHLVGVDAGLGSELADEARTLLTLARREFLPNEVRAHAWDQIIGGNLDARLALLAAGVASPLERESLCAARSLLGVIDGVVRQPWLGFGLRYLDDVYDSFQDPYPFPARWGLRSKYDDGLPIEWNGERWADFATFRIDIASRADRVGRVIHTLRRLGYERVRLAQNSPDPIVRELAFISDEPGNEPQLSAEVARDGTLSTMVHGTGAWKGGWWHPGGNFHKYMKDTHRPNLYSDGMPFSWSGAYRESDRRVAAHRFDAWVDSASNRQGMDTVFAHSYGCEVAARAVVDHQTSVHTLVMLSAPINGYWGAAPGKVTRMIDVRQRFDLVLALDRMYQWLSPRPENSSTSFGNVVTFRPNKQYWSHSKTHDPDFWDELGVAERTGL